MAIKFLFTRGMVAGLGIGLALPALAQQQASLPNSGSFTTHGGFKAVEQTISITERHTYSSGVVWGVVYNDSASGPLHIATAVCPYFNEVIEDISEFQGKCAWSEGSNDKIFTEWSAKFALSTGAGGGPQTITGGTGKYSGITGKGPFQCQALNDKGQFHCTQEWEYRLSSELTGATPRR